MSVSIRVHVCQLVDVMPVELACLTSGGRDERVVLPDGDSGSQGRKTKRVVVEVGHFPSLELRGASPGLNSRCVGQLWPRLSENTTHGFQDEPSLAQPAVCGRWSENGEVSPPRQGSDPGLQSLCRVCRRTRTRSPAHSRAREGAAGRETARGLDCRQPLRHQRI